MRNIINNINLIEFIIINLFYLIKTNFLCNIFNFQYSSKITLKIKGIGESTILGNSKNYNFTSINYLKEVYINGNLQETIDYKYYFNQTDNFIELILDDFDSNCYSMFYKCSNITKINLSNFDTSQVTNMYSMFDGCLSLTSLDLSNFDTSQVINMRSMFYDCS